MSKTSSIQLTYITFEKFRRSLILEPGQKLNYSDQLESLQVKYRNWSIEFFAKWIFSFWETECVTRILISISPGPRFPLSNRLRSVSKVLWFTEWSRSTSSVIIKNLVDK